MDIERAKQADRAWQDWTGVNVRRPGPFWLMWLFAALGFLAVPALCGRLGIPDQVQDDAGLLYPSAAEALRKDLAVARNTRGWHIELVTTAATHEAAMQAYAAEMQARDRRDVLVALRYVDKQLAVGVAWSERAAPYMGGGTYYRDSVTPRLATAFAAQRREVGLRAELTQLGDALANATRPPDTSPPRDARSAIADINVMFTLLFGGIALGLGWLWWRRRQAKRYWEQPPDGQR